MENTQTLSNQNPSEAEFQPQQINSNNSRLFIIVLISVLLTAIVAGSAVYFWQRSASEKAINSLEQKITSLEEQISVISKGGTISQPNSASLPPNTDTITKLEELLEFSKYSTFNDNKLTSVQNNKYQYLFDMGQDRENDVHNNYTVVFPDSWDLFIYTNEKNRDDYGSNIILKKGSDYIRIKQQLYESGSCVFEEEEVQMMSYLCELVEALKLPHGDWKVFTVPESGDTRQNTNAWMRFGVCDQDKYSQGISSYKEPDEHDKKICSPWTQVGEIEFFFSSKNQQNYEDFVNIVQSIQVNS